MLTLTILIFLSLVQYCDVTHLMSAGGSFNSSDEACDSTSCYYKYQLSSKAADLGARGCSPMIKGNI